MLSLPFALRYLLATRPEVVTQVLGIVCRATSCHLNLVGPEHAVADGDVVELHMR